ncbi:MAG: alanine racemase [Bacteroidota bacterium]
MSYKISDIAKILHAPDITSDAVVTELSTDSRKIARPDSTLFFALCSDRRDGHDFISTAYSLGVRAFVVSRTQSKNEYPDAVFLFVPDTLVALQRLAAYHRSQFNIPVIGITGSNGKTIVKEWLFQLLSPDFTIIRSPRSYNSQIGVPLSVWKMNATHTLAIFEAGISKPGEMEKLATIIRPTIGVLTHLGKAHDDGFVSRTQKEQEKRKLFEGAALPKPIILASRQTGSDHSVLTSVTGEVITIHFTDDASIENALTCWSVMQLLGYDNQTIASRMLSLQRVQMRLEIKRGIRQCLLLNDAYSLDLDSLSIALSHLKQQSGERRLTAILTDLPEGSEQAYFDLIDILRQNQVRRLIAIGPGFQSFLSGRFFDGLQIQQYPDVQQYEKQFVAHSFFQEAILLKGARRFQLEKLLPLLEAQLHQTRLEIDLSGLRHNIRAYQSVLRSGVKIMAMVKSFAYGSGGVEIARVMQEEGIAYLGVAYADEGVALREGGIQLPIMVMNTEPDAFDAMLTYQLEPVLYSIEMINSFQQFLQSQGETEFPVHLELETGMHRLGISSQSYDELRRVLTGAINFQIRSVFSHLAAGEDPKADPFSDGQLEQLMEGVSIVRAACQNKFLLHLSNSGAAVRRPDWQLDMVRIGIGLYGIDPAVSDKISLRPVASLLATVAQLQDLQPGESVSYNRRFIADRPTRIATIRLGYADGFPRRLGNGVGYVLMHGQQAPVLGSVCMDMFMVDVTSIENVKTGDTAVVFGPELPLTELSRLADTIPYEIMTGISQRVKRVYIEES